MALRSQLSILPVLLLLSIVICHVCHVTCQQRENKPNVKKYCGVQFLNMFNICCGNNPKCENSKRQIEDVGIFASRNLANKFLRISAKRHQNSLIAKRSNTDAVEECCYEGCSLSEIAEYSCI